MARCQLGSRSTFVHCSDPSKMLLTDLDESPFGERCYGRNAEIGDVCNDHCMTGFPSESSHLLDKIAARRGYACLNSAPNPVRIGQDEGGDTDHFRESPGLYCPRMPIHPHQFRKRRLQGNPCSCISSLPGFECLQDTPPNVALWAIS